MNNFTIFLGFVLVMTSMFMTFPKRARKATKCLTQLAGALFVSKAFQAMIANFKGRQR